jgi:cell wall-associated NlpC family hydrolase
MRAPWIRLALAGVALALLPVPGATAAWPGAAARASLSAPATVSPGAATVAVAVATLWHSPSSPRAVDAPALLKPVRMRTWLAAMSLTQRRALSGRADSQLVLGDRVRVLAVSGAWAHVVVPGQPTRLDPRGYPGWIPTRQLSRGWLPAAAPSVFVTAATTWLRRETGERSWEVSAGTRLERIGATPSYWLVRLPDGRTAKIPRSAVVTKLAPTTRSGVVAYARRFVGLSYLWAGTSGFGFDCSGFTSTVYRLNGRTIPRDSRDQARVGTAVRRSALRPGDLVFFSTGGVVHHVGLYIGGGRMLHAPHTGTKLQNSRVFAGTWGKEYSGARNLIH